MTLKEAKKVAVAEARHRGYVYLAISKQSEIGWYIEQQPTQRAVFFVMKDGTMALRKTDFARNYQRQYLPNIRIKHQ